VMEVSCDKHWIADEAKRLTRYQEKGSGFMTKE
jgi:hypothetical protein